MLNTNSGPDVTTGNVDSSNNHEPDQGPSLSFQGSGILDHRYVSTIGGAPGSKVYGIYSNSFATMVDGVPQAASATRIAAAQTATSGTPLTLVSAQGAGVSPNVPLVPFGQAYQALNVVKPALALDFGFSTANTVSGSTALTIPTGNWRYFFNGQRLIISGAGVNGGPLITQVAAAVVAGTSAITLAAPAQATLSNTQVGTADPTGLAAWPFAVGGVIALQDPTQAIVRGTSVTSNNAGDTGWTVTVRGYDLFGQAMTETINVTANGTAYGFKAFKFITSVTPTKSGSTAGTLSIGTSDLYGFSVRNDFWEYDNIFVNGSFLTSSTGWTAADATSPATATTKDVRGTIQIGVLGPNGSGAAGGPMDGVKRLAAFSSIPLYNALNANNLNYATLFGVTQF